MAATLNKKTSTRRSSQHSNSSVRSPVSGRWIRVDGPAYRDLRKLGYTDAQIKRGGIKKHSGGMKKHSGGMKKHSGGIKKHSRQNKVDYFEKGKYPHKYMAIMKDGKKVRFGHQDYEQFRDSVPVKMGGGQWSHVDHGDRKRRDNYRKRHGGVLNKEGKPAFKVKYSPSWFSYYYLW
jgi:hypothetical protein